MFDDWQFDVLNESAGSASEGRLVSVVATHRATAARLAASVRDDGEVTPAVVRVWRDDLGLPARLASNLMAEVYNHFAAELHRDDGSDGFTSYSPLSAVAHRSYVEAGIAGKVGAIMQQAATRGQEFGLGLDDQIEPRPVTVAAGTFLLRTHLRIRDVRRKLARAGIVNLVVTRSPLAEYDEQLMKDKS